MVYPGFLVSLLLHREFRRGEGMETRGKNVKSKLQKISSFIVVESHDDLPKHTHILPAAFVTP